MLTSTLHSKLEIIQQENTQRDLRMDLYGLEHLRALLGHSTDPSFMEISRLRFGDIESELETHEDLQFAALQYMEDPHSLCDNQLSPY